MNTLCDHYEGQDSMDIQVTFAQAVISLSGKSSSFYNDEPVFTFESYYPAEAITHYSRHLRAASGTGSRGHTTL